LSGKLDWEKAARVAKAKRVELLPKLVPQGPDDDPRARLRAYREGKLPILPGEIRVKLEPKRKRVRARPPKRMRKGGPIQQQRWKLVHEHGIKGCSKCGSVNPEQWGWVGQTRAGSNAGEWRAICRTCTDKWHAENGKRENNGSPAGNRISRHG